MKMKAAAYFKRTIPIQKRLQLSINRRKGQNNKAPLFSKKHP